MNVHTITHPVTDGGKELCRPARATHRSAAGWKRCSHTGGRQCAKCPYTPPTASSVTSHITGYTHNITTPIICSTENVIYLWRCTKCKTSFSINGRNDTSAIKPKLMKLDQTTQVVLKDSSRLDLESILDTLEMRILKNHQGFILAYLVIISIRA